MNGHEFFFHTPTAAVVARCARCHRHAATYWLTDTCTYPDCPTGGLRGEWRPSPKCLCNPAPELPSGERLDKLVQRALRKPPRSERSAPVGIRV